MRVRSFLSPHPMAARLRAARALGGLVLLSTMQLSARATWIEIQQAPPAPPRALVAGQVLSTSTQPRVALWNHRTAFDVFGRPIPAQVVYDSEIPGVLVSAKLRAADSGEPQDMLGASVLVTSCGKAQFTDLQIQKVGLYTLLFSATYLTGKETVNSTHAFEVACPCS